MLVTRLGALGADVVPDSWQAMQSKPVMAGDQYDVVYWAPDGADAPADFKAMLNKIRPVIANEVSLLGPQTLRARVTFKANGTISSELGHYMFGRNGFEHEARVVRLVKRGAPLSSETGLLDKLRYWFSPLDWRVVEDTKQEMQEDITDVGKAVGAGLTSALKPLIVPAVLVGAYLLLRDRK